MKPWYCKTAGYTHQQIQHALDLCVDNGACPYEGVDGYGSAVYACLHDPSDFNFFGVRVWDETFISNFYELFEGEEITLDQLPAHIGIESKEEKSKSQLLDDVCESLFGELASQCRDDVVSTVSAMIDGGWVKERGNESS